MGKLSYEDKVKIYYEKKKGRSRKDIASKYKIQESNVQYLVRLIDKHGFDVLRTVKRSKRKYSSYKGTVGKIADNLIKRDFNSDKPNKKWYTDVTEFNLRGEKCYLSPILDGYNDEVISYNTSKSPNLGQINDMLNKAFDKNKDLEGLIFHSDQGWQ